MAPQTPDSIAGILFGRILSIKKQEYVAVAWSFAYFFCVLSAYYILRPVREEMAVGSGPNTIPFLFIGTFFAMLLATPIFGWVATRYPRRQFLPWVYLFFISNILIFWGIFSLLIDRDQSYVWLGRAYFVWLSVFNLFVVSVFWSFMADIYSREQGRRLFGVIAAGGSAGALIGGIGTSIKVVEIGFHHLLPVAALLLGAAIICIRNLRHWVSLEQDDATRAASSQGKPLGGNPLAGMTHTFSSKYFGAISLISIIASLLGTLLYMFTAILVQDAIPDPDERVRLFSNMNVAQNVLAMLMQMFLVHRVVHRFGIGVAMTFLPIVSVIGFGVLALFPTLLVIAAVTVVRRAVGFAFSKPPSDMLYSVVTPEEKYKTKNFIDTTVYRAGDVIGTWSIRGLQVLGMGLSAISWLMLPFAALWAMVALWLGRDYRRRARKLSDSGLK